ncbi:hypothetical protein J5N97_014183 [Dioscorea zingiberensis]|uniref:Uncharacterized protein n=1 Tax=Dioscorea zingiberensis TaxID=325984 RepID=A0A9D5HJE7_9LILI|nr:hypothetical protein J5N97_014183 [Dioscorea zingiberensis]
MRPAQKWIGRGRGRGRGAVIGQHQNRSTGALEKFTRAPANHQDQSSVLPETITCAQANHVTSLPGMEPVLLSETQVTVLPRMEQTDTRHGEETLRGRTVQRSSRGGFNRGRGGGRHVSLIRSRASRERSSERQHEPAIKSLTTRPQEMTRPNRRKALNRGSGSKQGLDEDEIEERVNNDRLGRSQSPVYSSDNQLLISYLDEDRARNKKEKPPESSQGKGMHLDPPNYSSTHLNVIGRVKEALSKEDPVEDNDQFESEMSEEDDPPDRGEGQESLLFPPITLEGGNPKTSHLKKKGRNEPEEELQATTDICFT